MQKSAILLTALGEDLAAEVFKNLQPHELQRLAHAMQQIKKIPPEVIDAVLSEFLTLLKRSPSSSLTGGPGFLRDTLKKAFKDPMRDIAGIDNFIHTPPELPSLQYFEAPHLARFLQREHPQTAAIIVAHLEPKKFADTVRLLPAELRNDIILRVAKLAPIEAQIIDDVEQALQAELATQAATLHSQPLGGVEAIAAMLNQMDPKSAKTYLHDLGLKDAALAAEIEKNMFTFAHLVQLSDQGIQEILKNTPKLQLMKAFKQCDEAIKTLFYKNMSARACELFKEEAALLPKLRLTEVQEAQQAIVTLAQKLAQDGKIEILRGDEQYV